MSVVEIAKYISVGGIATAGCAVGVGATSSTAKAV